MKTIIIFGSPGAGKGTQAKLLAKKYNFIHLSSGDLLREEVSSGTILGKKIKKYQDEGILVPNELLTELIEVNVKNNLNSSGLIFDGYPRSIEQANILNNILSKNNLELTTALTLNIEEEEALKRLLLRGKTSGRSDDNEKVIKKRFQVYYKETKPILNYYQEKNKLINISGKNSVETVQKEIITKLNLL